MKRKITIIAGILALLMLAFTPINDAYASEVPNGWTMHDGDNYEMYITSYQNVSASELILVVNYGDELSLDVVLDDTVILDTYIGAKSSRFLPLSFTDSGTYTISLARGSVELFTIDKFREIVVPGTPPPPSWNDDGWNILPPGPAPWDPIPDTSDPLMYTKAAVDAMIAAVTIESLAITACLMAVSMVLGALIQRTVRFIWPTDFVTISMLVLIVMQIIGIPSGLVIPGIDPIWWIPFLVGYMIGYIVIGRTKYVMVRRITDDKSFETLPWVLYYVDGKPYLQEQTNKALLKRLLFGITHPVLCPVAIEPDYDDKTKYPGFPAFERKMVCVQKYETYEVKPSKEGRFYLKRYATEVVLAYGSTVSRFDIHRDVKALDKANASLIDAENQIFALNQSLSIRMADTVASFLAKVYSKAPGAVFKDAVNRWSKGDEDKDDQE